MKMIVALCLLLSSTVWAADPCTTQNYSDAGTEPRYDCPGPGEGALVPDLPSKPTKGLARGATVTPAGKKRKTFKVEYDSVLMGKMKVIELGMKIKGLRRLRWADRHRGAEALAIEKKFISATWTAKLQLRVSQLVQAKKQIAQARKERDEERKWYRSWTFGLVVGVVATSAAVIGTAVAIK